MNVENVENDQSKDGTYRAALPAIVGEEVKTSKAN